MSLRSLWILLLAACSLGGTQLLAQASADSSKSSDPQIFCPVMKNSQLKVNGELMTLFGITSVKMLTCAGQMPESEWKVTRSRWDEEDEKLWEQFLLKIGESKCNSLEKCLKDPRSNILWGEWDRTTAHYADCADFPYYLRAYFSFKRELPFSFVRTFSFKKLSPEIQKRYDNSRAAIQTQYAGDPKLAEKLREFDQLSSDPRYTWNGNNPAKRYSIPELNGESRSFFTSARIIRDQVSTGTYRMFETEGSVQADFYSPAISREGIRAGTVLYRPAGHAALIYKIDKDGLAHFIDAHPDNSVSRGTYSREYSRGNPNLGGGFKNWRPFVLMQSQKDGSGKAQWREAQADSTGLIRHGYFRFLSDSEISQCALGDDFTPCDYSDEQYRGNKPSADGDPHKGKYVLSGREVDFFDYVRFKLSSGKAIDPVKAFKDELGTLCEDIQGRVASVQTAVDAGLAGSAHPGVYPRNIYGADGEWEDYSTPGRDLRIRSRIPSLVSLARHYMAVIAKEDPTYSYWPENRMRSSSEKRKKLSALKRDFLDTYGEVARSCEVVYKNSNGQDIRLPFEVVLSRLSTMSFDPYMCVERRWGATQESELASCPDDSTKQAWYSRTQFLRNLSERDTTQVMGYDLNELKKMEQAGSIDNRVNKDAFNLLRKLEEL